MPPTTDNRPAIAALVRVRARTSGDRTVLAVAGEVDLASAPVLQAAVTGALEGGAAELLIDLSDTEFMDSAGLHLLMETQREAGRLRRRLAIVCPPGAVRRLFDIAGVAGTLPVHDDARSVA